MNNYVFVGKIVNSFGIKGELKIRSDFEYKDRIFKNNFNIFIGNDKLKEVISSYRIHKGYDLITLVGYTNITKKPNGDLFLGIGLAPKYCGKGLGSAILENSIEDAKNRYPGSKITLQVRSWNERARKCYEKAGFKFI